MFQYNSLFVHPVAQDVFPREWIKMNVKTDDN